MHGDRLREVLAEVKEGNRELTRTIGKQRVVGLESQLAVLGVIDLLHNLRRRPRRRNIWLFYERTRLLLQPIVGEGKLLTKLQASRCTCRQSESSNCERCQERTTGVDDHRPAIDTFHHTRTSACCVARSLGLSMFVKHMAGADGLCRSRAPFPWSPEGLSSPARIVGPA